MRDDFDKVLMTHHNSRQDDRMKKTRHRLTKDEILRVAEDDEFVDGVETSNKPFRANAWNRERSTYPNIRILIKWLKSRVGQPWDAVFAELSRLPPMGGYSIHDVLKNTVENHPQCIDGMMYDREGRALRGSPWWPEFYVDEQGLLQMAPHRSYKYSRKTNPNVVALEPMRELVRMNGLWFDVQYEPNPRPDYLGRWAAWDDRRIVQKKTLNAKELKQYGLSNTTTSGRIES